MRSHLLSEAFKAILHEPLKQVSLTIGCFLPGARLIRHMATSAVYYYIEALHESISKREPCRNDGESPVARYYRDV